MNALQAIQGVLLLIIIVVIPIIVFVCILRWLFRINEIVDYLKIIADKTDPVITPDMTKEIPYDFCDRCKSPFKISDLTTLEIGKRVCPDCKKTLDSMQSRCHK